MISATNFKKKQRAGIPKQVFERAELILEDIQKRGFQAVVEYAKKFDGFQLSEDNLTISVPTDIEDKLSPLQKRTIDIAFQKVEIVQTTIGNKLQEEIQAGSIVFKTRAVARAGIYVPGGMAPLPSSLLMAGVTARAAGVKEIIVCTPPQKKGISPAILYLAKKLNITKIYQIGGAQAIAAMAYGLPNLLKKVDMICGPGNVYVAAAKQIVAAQGIVKIDMVAGPSEVLIIADKNARADYVAADMLAQAEHGVNSPAILLTDSKQLAEQVQEELQKQLPEIETRETAEQSLRDYGSIVLVDTLKQAITITNDYAPEHLEILTDDAKQLARKITCSGAIFINTCESFADYGMTGGNHILPTGGTARFLSGLSANDFLVRTYIEEMSNKEQSELAELAATFADLEGLDAHARAARLRKGEKS